MHICSSRLGGAAGPDVPRFSADELVRTSVSNPTVAAFGVRVHAVYNPRLFGGHAEQQSHVVRWLAGAFYGRHCG